ncbi:MAG: glutamate--tRNA ligase [Clostridiales bacterium]|nr:glutamate--tRNA ligase [Clostridiales bacterium]
MMRTRFAPSPTGFMHIGNLRTALFGYLLARRMGGVFALRIEDTDIGRYVPEALDKIYETLKIAGIKHDEGPDIGGNYGPYVQSERKDSYLKQAEALIELGAAYYCICAPGEEACNCRAAGLARPEGPYAIRQLIPPGQTTFSDLVYGEITVENSELEDQVLIKQDGMPTYNFANVVDDHFMAITHVLRGSEYLPSTPKYNLLYEAFGWPIPTYVHLPLILSADGGKLSKRRGDAFFEDFLEKGFLPEAIVNYIVLLGWSPPDNREIYTLAELEQVFGIEGLSKAPSTFDLAKLKWMNGEYFKAMSGKNFEPLAAPYLAAAVKREDINRSALSLMVKDRIATLLEIREILDFIDVLPEYGADLFMNKKNKSTPETAKDMLSKLLPEMEAFPAENWESGAIYKFLTDFAEAQGVKNSLVLWPIRCALSGKESSPGGATELLNVFGKNESVARIKQALEVL